MQNGAQGAHAGFSPLPDAGRTSILPSANLKDRAASVLRNRVDRPVSRAVCSAPVSSRSIGESPVLYAGFAACWCLPSSHLLVGCGMHSALRVLRPGARSLDRQTRVRSSAFAVWFFLPGCRNPSAASLPNRGVMYDSQACNRVRLAKGCQRTTFQRVSPNLLENPWLLKPGVFFFGAGIQRLRCPHRRLRSKRFQPVRALAALGAGISAAGGLTGGCEATAVGFRAIL